MHRPVVADLRFSAVICFAALWALTTVPGCGGGDAPPSEAKQVFMIIDEMSDVAGDRERFRSCFAEGAVPPESQRLRYRRYTFIVSSPGISGDTATATVTIKDVSTSNPVGEMQWTAVKQGGKWKLKSVPLPPASK